MKPRGNDLADTRGPAHRGGARRIDTAERLYRHIDRTPGQGPGGTCHLVTGLRLESSGYVRIKHGGRKVLLHRWVLAQALGRDLLPGMYALHTCDVRHCGNAAHLYEGTLGDNNRDTAARGRSNPMPGYHTGIGAQKAGSW